MKRNEERLRAVPLNLISAEWHYRWTTLTKHRPFMERRGMMGSCNDGRIYLRKALMSSGGLVMRCTSTPIFQVMSVFTLLAFMGGGMGCSPSQEEMGGYPVWCVAFSGDGKFIAVGGGPQGEEGREVGKGAIWIWNVNTLKQVRTVTDFQSRVTCLSFESGDGDLLAAGSIDFVPANNGAPRVNGRVTVLNYKTGEEIKALRTGTLQVEAVKFVPPKEKVLVASNTNGGLRAWETSGWKERNLFEKKPESVFLFAVGRDGKQMGTVSTNGIEATMWDLSTGKEQAKLKGHTKRICCIGFDPNGGNVVSGSDDGTIRLWNAENGKEMLKLNYGSAGPASVEVSPDGTLLAACAANGSIQLWDLKKESIRFTLGRKGIWARSLSFSPSGKILATVGGEGNSDGQVRLWDVTSGEESAILRK